MRAGERASIRKLINARSLLLNADQPRPAPDVGGASSGAQGRAPPPCYEQASSLAHASAPPPPPPPSHDQAASSSAHFSSAHSSASALPPCYEQLGLPPPPPYEQCVEHTPPYEQCVEHAAAARPVTHDVAAVESFVEEFVQLLASSVDKSPDFRAAIFGEVPCRDLRSVSVLLYARWMRNAKGVGCRG